MPNDRVQRRAQRVRCNDVLGGAWPTGSLGSRIAKDYANCRPNERDVMEAPELASVRLGLEIEKKPDAEEKL